MQVIIPETIEGTTRPQAAKVADTPAPQDQLFRVVHTSGELIVSTLAEAKALLTKLPGARVFCAPALQH